MRCEKAFGMLFLLKKIHSPWPYLKLVQGHLLSKVLFTDSVCTVQQDCSKILCRSSCFSSTCSLVDQYNFSGKPEVKSYQLRQDFALLYFLAVFKSFACLSFVLKLIACGQATHGTWLLQQALFFNKHLKNGGALH